MPPGIRSRDARRGATALVWVALLAGLAHPRAAAQGFGPSPVRVVAAEEREVAEERTFVGSVVAARTTVVGSQVDGYVVEYLAREGRRMKQGEVLARLRTGTVDIQIVQAKAELDLRQQELAELEHGWRPKEIEQAQARLASIEARLDYARTSVERMRRLFEPRTVSEGELDQSEAEWRRAEQDRIEAKAALDMMVEGTRVERVAQARAKLAMQEGAVRRLEDEREKHVIVAPFDGHVVAEHAEVGRWLAKGGPVAEISELDRVDVEVPVLEDCVSRLGPGQPARVEIGALPGQVFEGRIVSVVPRADLRARTFPVKVRLDNREAPGGVLLKAGLFARVTLAVGEPVRALLVPKDALVLGGPAPMVWVVDADTADPAKGKVRPVPVQSGISAEGWIAVTGPLRAGDRVVVQGNERLRPGQDVAVIPGEDSPQKK